MCLATVIQQKIADLQAALSALGTAATAVAQKTVEIAQITAYLKNCKETECEGNIDAEGTEWHENAAATAQTIGNELATSLVELGNALESLSTFEDSGSVGE